MILIVMAVLAAVWVLIYALMSAADLNSQRVTDLSARLMERQFVEYCDPLHFEATTSGGNTYPCYRQGNYVVVSASGGESVKIYLKGNAQNELPRLMFEATPHGGKIYSPFGDATRQFRNDFGI